MQTISSMLRRKSSKQRTIVVVLTNDASLGRETDLESGVEAFLRALPSDLQKAMKIRFLCSLTTSLQLSSSSYEETSVVAMTRRLLYSCSQVESRFFSNIGLQFEEELRSLLESFCRTVYASIQLPKYGMGRLANLELELSSFTLSSEDSIHEGLQSPSVYCLASTDQVDPLLIVGKGLKVAPSTRLPDGPAHCSNVATFKALITVLAAYESMLVVRTTNNKGWQYYGMIPPPKNHGGHMAMVQLATREDILRMGEDAFVPFTTPPDEV